MGLGYTGEPQTGDLLHLRARTLDTASGRFLSIDPAWAGTYTAYAYAKGVPVLLGDPSGLATRDLCLAGAVAVGGTGAFRFVW